MSGLRLREAFNRLLNHQYTQFLKRGAAAMMLTVSLSIPALAHHDENKELDVYSSGTKHSQELQSIQDRFNQAVKDRRIILVDRDWIQMNEAINNLPPGDTEQRKRYLVEYMVQRGQMHVPKEMFRNMSDDQLYDNPHAQTFMLRTAAGNQQVRVCTVYGARGEQDGPSAVRDFISASTAVHGPDIAGADIRLAPDARTYKQFVIYHEIGHCMDDWFVTGIRDAKTLGEQMSYFHRAESFADVHAALLMAREEGITDIAETIANTRLVNAALSGPYRSIWADPASKGYYSSYIYSTHRSVRATQDYIDKNGAQSLQALSYQEIAELARDIVDQNALSDFEAEVLLDLFDAKFDLSTWEKVKKDVPYIAKRYPVALQLKQEMEQALRTLLDLNHIPANQSALELMSFAGNPYMRMAELQAQQNPFADEIRAMVLSRVLLKEAGGKNASIKDLTETFIRSKDQWRADLLSADDTDRKEAQDNLKVAGRALRLAAQTIRDNAPSSNTPKPILVDQPSGPSGMGVS
ncbi:MAG: hypothetical protein H6867_03785 [Rhodospirillales bacterium]|nr:hypothetical protein [Rhodospirillales bacterium]MCB9996271.1 hypothetical protein [Rhodospirillales bacterium]